MYRQYENPRTLEERLKEMQETYNECFDRAKRLGITAAEWEYLGDMATDIEDLKERINFAWQDEAYDMEGEW